MKYASYLRSQNRAPGTLAITNKWCGHACLGSPRQECRGWAVRASSLMPWTTRPLHVRAANPEPKTANGELPVYLVYSTLTQFASQPKLWEVTVGRPADSVVCRSPGVLGLQYSLAAPGEFDLSVDSAGWVQRMDLSSHPTLSQSVGSKIGQRMIF